jgi:hypothetical protein
LQRYVTPLSELERPNSAFVLVVVVGIPATVGGGGGVKSTRQVKLVPTLTAPPDPTAFTENVCFPSESDEYVRGDVQPAYPVPSS